MIDRGSAETTVKIFAHLSIVLLLCCGLMAFGAITLGRRSDGLSFGYQAAGYTCTIQMIDTERPSDSFARSSKRPFCLLNSAWSPDRHYAAIRKSPIGSLSIVTGQNRREWQVLFDFEAIIPLDGTLAWSADSRQLAFFKSTSTTVLGILSMENGERGKPLLHTVQDTYPISYSPPAWSPDGQFIAFAAYASSRDQGNEELYILNVNSGEVRRLTDNHYRDDSPSWSPDGSQLVFTSAEDGYNELHIMTVATGERRQLTRFTIGYIPSWSPDGKSIMFMSNMDYNNDLYIIGVDGTGLRRLTNNHYGNSVYPIWLFPS